MKEFNGVQYEGYDPQTERCKFSVPKGYGTAIPYPNARLISAAPDLLEAAEQAEYWLNEEAHDPNATSIYPDEILRVLRAAIAKAKEE